MSYPSYQAASSPGNVLFFTKKDAKKNAEKAVEVLVQVFFGTSFAYTAVVRNVFFSQEVLYNSVAHEPEVGD